MVLLDSSLTEDPVNLENFKFLNSNDYPYCLVGYEIKNQYDERRLSIPSSHKPLNIAHFEPTNKFALRFFRGSQIRPKARFASLIKQLEDLNLTLQENISPLYYSELLSDYGLNCDGSLYRLGKGVYPINCKCLNDFSLHSYDLASLYSGDHTSEIMPFQRIAPMNIFVLSNKSINNLTLEQLVSQYLEKQS